MKTKFKVELTNRFSRQIRTLDQKAQVQIINEAYSWRENPKVDKPLHGEFKGVLSTRVGKYRILYKIEGEKIILLAVGHRKHVYK